MGEKERIFLVDDESTNIRTLTRLLEASHHNVVAEASSLSDVSAIAWDEDIHFSVAIVDGRMPNEGDGEKAAQILREARKEIKIISLSADMQTFGNVNLEKTMGPLAVLKAVKEI